MRAIVRRETRRDSESHLSAAPGAACFRSCGLIYFMVGCKGALDRRGVIPALFGLGHFECCLPAGAYFRCSPHCCCRPIAAGNSATWCLQQQQQYAWGAQASGRCMRRGPPGPWHAAVREQPPAASQLPCCRCLLIPLIHSWMQCHSTPARQWTQRGQQSAHLAAVPRQRTQMVRAPLPSALARTGAAFSFIYVLFCCACRRG